MAKFTSHLQIVDRFGEIEEKCAYILFKDHNFQDRKWVRLINPTKTKLGLLSNDLIPRITSKFLSCPKYNLWKNSLDTIDWFKNIKNKKRSTFIHFDIIEFYPSITRELFLKSLNHTREYMDITDEEIEIILSDNHRTWMKSHMDNFNVPMGTYDSAQVTDLIGIYIIWSYCQLYRDDGIIFIPDSNSPQDLYRRRLLGDLKY